MFYLKKCQKTKWNTVYSPVHWLFQAALHKSNIAVLVQNQIVVISSPDFLFNQHLGQEL